MKMSTTEIEAYVDLWLSLKPYLNPKDKIVACEKFMNVINESVCEIADMYDEWVGFDGTLDRVIRDNYIEHIELDDYDNDDEW